MKITFIGAAHEVTGSCTYIEVGDKRGIVDYGMEQGKDLFVNKELPVNPDELDFVLLTHAHVDHSGMLPLLYKRGFRGAVYATAATCSLCDIMLRDCANIQMSDAEWKSRKAMRKGEDEVEPVYDMDDAIGVLKLFIPCSYNTIIQVNEAVSIRMTDVGHLLGSSAIEVWLTENGETKKITFSGDIGNRAQAILRDPQKVSETDYLVIESTYGDRLHSTERPDYVAELAKRIQTTLDRGGNVVIPSFAVGRTQEILYFIREIKQKNLVSGHGEFPVYVDSPLSNEATSIFLQCDEQFLDDEMRGIIRSGVNPLWFPGLNLSSSQEESKAINSEKTPKVIIASSGMCDAGRIRHHLKHNLWRKESLILFVGYQSPGTLGRMIVDGLKHVKLFDEDIQIKAKIDTLPAISGHADKAGLLDWLKGFEKKPVMTFVNHGDPESADSFTKCIMEQLQYNAFAPYSGTEFDLLSGEFVKITDGIPIEKKKQTQQKKVSAAYTHLIAAAERLLAIAKKSDGLANKELIKFTDKINDIANKLEK